MIFARIHDAHICMHTCMYGGSQRSHEKSLDLKSAQYECAANVSMFCMLAQKTQQKAAIHPDKVEHFTHTFESLSPEIYNGVRITCTCIVQHTFVTHDLAPDCWGEVKRGLTAFTVNASCAVFLNSEVTYGAVMDGMCVVVFPWNAYSSSHDSEGDHTACNYHRHPCYYYTYNHSSSHGGDYNKSGGGAGNNQAFG